MTAMEKDRLMCGPDFHKHRSSFGIARTLTLRHSSDPVVNVRLVNCLPICHVYFAFTASAEFACQTNRQREWNRRAKITCRSLHSRHHVLLGDLTALGTPGTHAIPCDPCICSRKTVFVHHTALCPTSEQFGQDTEAAQQASHSGREDTLQSSLRSREWDWRRWYSERHNLPSTSARESSHARCLCSVRLPSHSVPGAKFTYYTTSGWLCEEPIGDDLLRTYPCSGLSYRLQFMSAGLDRTAVPTSIHCDHLIQASTGADADLKVQSPSRWFSLG